jgi:hypothetical protein
MAPTIHGPLSVHLRLAKHFPTFLHDLESTDRFGFVFGHDVVGTVAHRPPLRRRRH